MNLSDDLLRGVSMISDFTGLTPRQTYHALEKGHLPAFKVGNIWHVRKSTLIADIERREGLGE